MEVGEAGHKYSLQCKACFSKAVDKNLAPAKAGVKSLTNRAFGRINGEENNKHIVNSMIGKHYYELR